MRRVILPALLVAGAACHPNRPKDEAVTPAVRVAAKLEIPYPPELYTQRVEGQVLLYLYVDSAGTVVNDSTRIARSSGQPAFDAAALEAAPHLRFTPAHRGTLAVAAPIQVPINFSLPDSLSRKP